MMGLGLMEILLLAAVVVIPLVVILVFALRTAKSDEPRREE